MANLHPLCPRRDLAIYCTRGKNLTKVELASWLIERDELLVLEGFPTHADSDEISISNFNRSFKLSSNVLVLPSKDPDLPKSLGLRLINYTKQLEIALRTAWGKFEKFEEVRECVGEVYEVNIEREITRYIRRS